MNDIWTIWHEELRANAHAGKKRRSFEFFLVETVHPFNEKIEDVKDMIDTTVEFVSIAERITLVEAKKIVHDNIRYIAGYYDEFVCKTWRAILNAYD